ncbi:MAG TPA: hypothetical protein PLZ51_15620, partial [Aggregatilineales bacterium]|nr:hypothetical protein [Aggregatilineales bacterium]
ITASSQPVSIGTAFEIPHPRIGFIGKAGETITIRMVDDAVQSDEALSGLAGFMDSSANLMRTAATNRLNTIVEEANLRDQLARDGAGEIPIFTTNQRQQRQAELADIVLEPPII